MTVQLVTSLMTPVQTHQCCYCLPAATARDSETKGYRKKRRRGWQINIPHLLNNEWNHVDKLRVLSCGRWKHDAATDTFSRLGLLRRLPPPPFSQQTDLSLRLVWTARRTDLLSLLVQAEHSGLNTCYWMEQLVYFNLSSDSVHTTQIPLHSFINLEEKSISNAGWDLMKPANDLSVAHLTLGSKAMTWPLQREAHKDVFTVSKRTSWVNVWQDDQRRTDRWSYVNL